MAFRDMVELERGKSEQLLLKDDEKDFLINMLGYREGTIMMLKCDQNKFVSVAGNCSMFCTIEKVFESMETPNK